MIRFAPVLVWLLLSCSDVFVPAGLYGYQVERLLTGGESSKTWRLLSSEMEGGTIATGGCGNNTRLVFEIITADSIVAYELSDNMNCAFIDTIFLGQVEASVSNLLFTDTLYLGETKSAFWRIETLTSSSLIYQEDEPKARKFYTVLAP